MSEEDTLFETEGGTHTATVEVLRVVYKAEDDGYAVMEVRNTESQDKHTLIGPIAHLNPGDRAEVSGDWQTHATYGRQLRAQRAVPMDPEDREGRIAYLASLRHIGPARAKQLVDEHGEEVMQEITANPAAVFGSLRGMNVGRVDAAVESWHASRAIRDLHVQLAPHGLAHLAAPIHARFGDRAMAVLHEDPYRLTEVVGVGFARADKIALAGDVPPESSRRAQAAAFFALAEAEQGGSTYLPLPELVAQTARLLGLTPDPEVFADAPGLAFEGENAYRGATLASEILVGEILQNRLDGPFQPRLHAPRLAAGGRGSQRRPDPGQWAAVSGAFSSRISIVTGAPASARPSAPTRSSARARKPTCDWLSVHPPAGPRGDWRKRPRTRQ